MARERPLVVSVIGTRPEAIKMAPVIEALARSGAVRQEVLLTGQHGGLGPPSPSAPVHDLALPLAAQSPGEAAETIAYAVAEHLIRRPARLLLVQGDTSSALGGALGAVEAGIALGHVEAGLRSGDPLQPWPEELNRIRIDRCSDLLFAPTGHAARNLREDPLVTGAIQVTGNSGIDALLAARRGLARPRRSTGRRRTLLVTCHRRENRGERLERIAAAMKRMVRELPVAILLPLHPNEHVRREVEPLFAGEAHIRLLEPQDYRGMVALMARCWAILTDSGGLQEEGPALGRPVLILREVTERPEAIASGNARLVGTDPERIIGAVADLLADKQRYERMARPAFPFGDGRASERIADAILARLEAE